MRVFVIKNANGAELPLSMIETLPILAGTVKTMRLFGTTIAVEMGDKFFTDRRKEHYKAENGRDYRITFNYREPFVDDEWEEVNV